MNARRGLVVVAALLAGGLAWLTLGREAPNEPARAAAPELRAEERAAARVAPPAKVPVEAGERGGVSAESEVEPDGDPAPLVTVPAPVSLRGVVLDSNGRGVADVGVLAELRGGEARATTGPDGRFEFAGLAAGSCTVSVIEDTVPEGYVSPFQQMAFEAHRFPDAEPGFFKPRVELPSANELVLRVFRPGVVIGRVVQVDGGGAAGHFVSLRGPSIRRPVPTYSIVTDASGAFRIGACCRGSTGSRRTSGSTQRGSPPERAPRRASFACGTARP